MMNKEQQKALVKAWELSNKIVSEIIVLTEINERLAYDCIRTAETLIDLMREAPKEGEE